jgi:hypothetical protein
MINVAAIIIIIIIAITIIIIIIIITIIIVVVVVVFISPLFCLRLTALNLAFAEHCQTVYTNPSKGFSPPILSLLTS